MSHLTGLRWRFIQIKTFLQDLPLFKHVEFCFLSVEFFASFQDSHFLVFFQKPQKCFKTPAKLSLAVCGSFWGEIFFCDNCHISLVWTKKRCFHQIKTFLQDLPLTYLGEKRFLSVEFLGYFWVVTFWSIIFFFLISAKMLQNIRKA